MTTDNNNSAVTAPMWRDCDDRAVPESEIQSSRLSLASRTTLRAGLGTGRSSRSACRCHRLFNNAPQLRLFLFGFPLSNHTSVAGSQIFGGFFILIPAQSCRIDENNNRGDDHDTSNAEDAGQKAAVRRLVSSNKRDHRDHRNQYCGHNQRENQSVGSNERHVSDQRISCQQDDCRCARYSHSSKNRVTGSLNALVGFDSNNSVSTPVHTVFLDWSSEKNRTSDPHRVVG